VVSHKAARLLTRLSSGRAVNRLNYVRASVRPPLNARALDGPQMAGR
jgi:hypothetical protein